VFDLLDAHLDAGVDLSSRKRLALLVVGILRARSGAPARVAKALEELGLTQATAESIERRIRRMENDEELEAALCFHPFARARLLFSSPEELVLILDPTTQDDRVVMLSACAWYRGRALPIAWMVWPANQPLTGARFWERVEMLLDTVAQILPVGIPVTFVADRAFGTPAFTDLVTQRGWHYLVRVQRQTTCQDRQGVDHTIGHLVERPGGRVKLQGEVFKKRGWRKASVVVYWGSRHETPLCLVSDLPGAWSLIRLYRRRYPIEATFRDYKSSGWRWEQGQVKNLEHLERLLVGMALATWVALYVGTQVAEKHLADPPTGRRRTVPWIGKRSLFHLGVQRINELFTQNQQVLLRWELTRWDGLNWQQQIYFHHARAFVFAFRQAKTTPARA